MIPQYIVPAFLPLYNKPFTFMYQWGGRGGAKSVQDAGYCINESSRRKVRVLCVRQVQKSIDQSVYSLLVDEIASQGRTKEFIILAKSIMHRMTGSEFIFTGLQDHTADSLKSYHAIDICWIEEAHSVTKKSLDILIPTVIRTIGCKFIFSYNRYDEVDPCHKRAMGMLQTSKKMAFIETKTKNKYTWEQYDGSTVINGKKYHSIGIFINGRTGNPKWNDGLELEYQRCKRDDPETFPHIFLGEPIAQGEFACISRESVMEAVTRDVKTTDMEYFLGVDVARHGVDKTVLYLRNQNKSIACKAMQGNKLTEVCALIESFLEEHKVPKSRLQINVDDNGVGGGVSDILEDNYGYHVNEINFGKNAVDKKKYDIIASELWFSLRERIHEISLLDIPDLRDELTTRRWGMDKSQRRCIESKKIYKKRHSKSPDYADACILCFYVHAYKFAAIPGGIGGIRINI